VGEPVGLSVQLGVRQRSVGARPSELADAVNLRCDPAVTEPGIKFDDHIRIAAFAPDLPDEFVLRPEAVLFVLFGSNRHEIRQNNFQGVARECSFEHVRVVQITPRDFAFTLGPNAPASPNFWIKNRAED